MRLHVLPSRTIKQASVMGKVKLKEANAMVKEEGVILNQRKEEQFIVQITAEDRNETREPTNLHNITSGRNAERWRTWVRITCL